MAGEELGKKLFDAVLGNDVALMRQLLDQGADPNGSHGIGYSGSLLHVAARHESFDACELLLSRGARLDCVDDAGVNVLHAAAAFGSIGNIRRFIALGLDVNASKSNGQTPLHRAADAGQVPACIVLLDAGADPALEDQNGKMPAELGKEATASAIRSWIAQRIAREAASELCPTLP